MRKNPSMSASPPPPGEAAWEPDHPDSDSQTNGHDDEWWDDEAEQQAQQAHRDLGDQPEPDLPARDSDSLTNAGEEEGDDDDNDDEEEDIAGLTSAARAALHEEDPDNELEHVVGLLGGEEDIELLGSPRGGDRGVDASVAASSFISDSTQHARNEDLISDEGNNEEPPSPPASSPPDDENNEVWMVSSSEEEEGDNNDDDRADAPPSNVIFSSGGGDDIDFSPALFRIRPRDANGHLILIFIPALVKHALRDSQLDVRESGFSDFVAKTMRGVMMDGPRYVLVIVTGEDHTRPGDSDAGEVTRFDLLYMMEVFTTTLDRKVRKNVQYVYILHPTPLASSALWLLRLTLSKKFWRKLMFVRRLNDMPNMDIQALTDALPVWAVSTDLAEEKRRSVARPGASPRPALLMNFSSHWRVAPQFVGAYLWEQIDKSPFALPSFVVRAVTYLCLHGVKVEGLFRESANKERVVHSRHMLSQGQDVDFGGYWSASGRPATPEDVHVVAALLKMYFRDSPLSILGHAAFSDVMRSASRTDISTNELVEVFKKVVLMLAPPNRQLLHFLMLFLSYVVRYERVNRMGATAMSVCWGPNLIRDDSDTATAGDFLMAMGTVHRASCVLLERVAEVFPQDETTIFPPCHSCATGEPLPLDEVLLYDVTRAASSPSLVDQREFDDMLAVQMRNESRLEGGGGGGGMAGVGGDIVEDDFVAPHSLEELESMSIRDLKAWLTKSKYDVSACKEKADLLVLARQAFATTSAHQGGHGNLAKRVSRSSSGGGGGGPAPRNSATPLSAAAATDTFRSTLAPGDQDFDEIPVDEGGGEVPVAAPPQQLQHQLAKNPKDLITSCRALKLRFPLREAFVMEEDKLVNVDAEELRNTALFGSATETQAAQEGLDVDFGGKRWSLQAISTMATSELKRLIEAYGHEYSDCKGVSALRERARECLLGGPPLGLMR